MSRLHTYAQLVRLPNLPSALSNICLGALAAGALPQRWLPFGLLLLASACLYCGGMVWNDYFDRLEDKRERPGRPIPSGRVAPGDAARLGALLLLSGVLLAALAGWSLALTGRGSVVPAVLALLLAGMILLYDGPLKHTPAGPVAMGLCRLLNVLLGVAASGGIAGPRGIHLAAIVGLYVVGVTWFARTEGRMSNRNALRGAAGVMLASLVLALPLPTTVEPGISSPLFPYLLVVFAFVVGLPVSQAIASPTPARVQAAVGRALLGLILLDAILASAVVGTPGLAILVLWLPAAWLKRQAALYVT
jgi:4-hydroxybenzoate polyprenyltransferase